MRRGMPFVRITVRVAADTPAARGGGRDAPNRDSMARMRLGFLGPLPDDNDDLEPLEAAAELLLQEHQVQRAIYLGADDALELAVEDWARRLVGDDPSDEAMWTRAARLASDGTAEAIDAFVAAHRIRQRLRSLESLPQRILRTIEMVGDRIAVLAYDKSFIDDEDIYAASFLIYGKSEAPLVKKLGSRWFLTPGPLGPEGGVCVLDETDDVVLATLFAADGRALQTEQLHLPKREKPRSPSSP